MTIAVILCISIVLPFQNGEGQGRKTNKRRVPDQPGTQKPENEKNFKPAKNGKKKICRENVLDEIRNVFQKRIRVQIYLNRGIGKHEGEAEPQEPTGG